MNDATVRDKAANPTDIIRDGWYFHAHYDRRLSENGYIIPIVWFEITNNAAPRLGERVMATEWFQVGDLAITKITGLYQHLVSAHNRTLPSPARPRNPNQPRVNGKFVKKTTVIPEE